MTIVPDFAEEHDRVGGRVSLEGLRGVGSAAFAKEGGVVTGAVFRFDSATGATQQRLSPGDLEEHSDFGVGVAIRGDRILVGADDEPAPRPGSAYLFDATSNDLVATLRADDAVAGSDFWFGYSTALTSSHAIVGAPAFRTPAAYVFDSTTGAYLRKLTSANAASGFGLAVAANDSVVVVGAPGESAAYLFDLQSGLELGVLTGDDTTPFDQFGASVAIDGNLAVIGAYHAGGGGAAYVFDLLSGQQVAKFSSPDPNQAFGQAVAVDGVRVLVGAPPRSPGEGAAYLYDLDTNTMLAELADGVAGDDYFGNSVALAGNIAIVGDTAGRNNVGLKTGAFYQFAIPEPSTWALTAVGLLATSGRRRIRKFS